MDKVEFDYYYGDEYEIKNTEKELIGNLYDKQIGLTKDIKKTEEIIIGEETEEGMNIRFIDGKDSEDLQKHSK